MDYYRRLKTFIYMMLATLLGWICAYLIEVGIKGVFLFLSPPILLGLALAFSNKEYLKNNLSIVFIPFGFLLIFLYGTLPFSYLGILIFNNSFSYRLFGCISAFILIAVITKIAIKNVNFSMLNVLLTICLPFACLIVESIIKHKPLNELPISVVHSRLDLTILIYQFFISINIVLMLNSRTKRSMKIN